MPIRRIDVSRAHDDDEKDDAKLQDDDAGIEAGAFLDSLHQDDGDEPRDPDSGQIEPSASGYQSSGGRTVIKGRVGEDERQLDAEEIVDLWVLEKILEVMRPTM